MMSTPLKFPKDLMVGSSPRESAWGGKGLLQLIPPNNNPPWWEVRGRNCRGMLWRDAAEWLAPGFIFSYVSDKAEAPLSRDSTGHWDGLSLINQENVPQPWRSDKGSCSSEAPSSQERQADNHD